MSEDPGFNLAVKFRGCSNGFGKVIMKGSRVFYMSYVC